MATLTLIGMYNFDNTIFDNLTLPVGIDKATFVNTLLMEKGEFCLIYPDQNFLKNMINVWGIKWSRTFAEWLRGTQATWNPIENYDRYEDLKEYKSGEHTDKTTANYNNDRTADLTDKRTANLEDARTANLEDKRTADLTDKRTLNVDDKTTFNSTLTDTQTVDGTSTHDVSAFDSSSYSHESKDITNSGTVTHAHTGDDTISHDGTDTLDTTGTDTMSHTGTDTVKTTGTDTMDHTGTDKIHINGTIADRTGTNHDTTRAVNHIHGNIGVTQASEMLQSFYDISTWNLYKNMSDVFARELLICIY